MNATNDMKKITCKGLLRGLIIIAAVLCTALPAQGQNNGYVFYNATYGYLYNDGGTLTAGPLRFDSSSVWIASGTIGGTSRTIQTYKDNPDIYLGPNGSLSTTSYYWRGSNNYICYRNGSNYYLKATGATTFNTSSTQSNGERFRYYTVTIRGGSEVLTDFTINSGADQITATGNYTYGHSNANYTPAYTNYYFSNTNHYVGKNNNDLGNSLNSTAVTTGYVWSLSGNATGYATMVDNELRVTALPDYDIAITLTCTLTHDGITKTATKDIAIQGTNPPAPIISVSGSTITLSTDAVGTTTIRYTIDGTDPTPSTGTVYSGAIDLSSSATSPITIKAVTVRAGNASSVAEQVVTLTLPTPVITTDPTAGTATIACDNTSATIYYTTDGTEPSSTNGTAYTTTITGLTMMQKVKAIAILENWNNSAIAEAMVKISSNISGGTVTLFDYEDHTWTYYAGVDAGIDGGSYNTNYNGTLYSPNPRNVKITYSGNGGAVAWNAPETEFVYYKTIEKKDGKYSYTLIPNPFSKRPTEGSGNTRWRGFSAWKVVSVDGGTITSSDGNTTYAANSTIPAETEICFNPTRTYTTNCQSMEVEFEAVWVQAYVATSVSTTGLNGTSYETNFVVLTSGTTNDINNFGKTATISALYPNGTTDGTNEPAANWTPTTGISGTFSCSNNIKVEYIRMSGSGTITANNKYLILGRGIVGGGTNGLCSGIVQGMTNTASNAQLNFHIRIESGIYNYLTFTNGYGSRYGTNPGGYNNNVVAFSANNNFIRGTLGCDYDRATSNNTLLKVQQEMFYGYYSTFSNSGNTSRETFNVVAKSGDFCSAKNNDIADAEESFYASLGGQQTNVGRRVLTIEGGQFLSIAGGIDANNSASDETFFVRMKGGTLRGSLYGAGAFAAAQGHRRYVITGGTIKGWIAGGCNGTDPNQSGGTLPSNTYLYIGGTSHVGNNTDITINTSSDGNVFGAGSGNSAQPTTGQVNNSNVVIADECYVKKNVYGGGNYGYSNATATVYVTGGEVASSVFGGSNQKQGVTVNINMTGGQVDNGVYGGSNASGTISGNVTMKINGGTVGDGTDGDGIFGGGYGANTAVNGNVGVTLGASTSAATSATVNGNVYGGSALGSTNTGSNNNTTTVTMNKATVNGNVFGGAYGNGATVNGLITVNINGGTVNGNVFGGGDAAAYGRNGLNYPLVNMSGGTVTNIFGGGKGGTATVTGNPKVTLSGNANVTGNVYGGGDAAQVSGHTNVILRD